MTTKFLPLPSQAFRYPGGKGKIWREIINWFPPRLTSFFLRESVNTYCEPFVGSGAMLSRVLPFLPKSASIVLGDMDPGIAAYWQCLCAQDFADQLCSRVMNFTPTTDAFYSFKSQDGTYTTLVDTAFRKLALHLTSHSGLGAKAGGPIGGRTQENKKHDVTCRFRPERHVKNIQLLRRWLVRFRAVEVVHGDFADALARTPAGGFAYLDPPYYLKGGQLYVHSMTTADHTRLADVLRAAPYDWVLSYDDHPEVRRLYADWSDIHTFEMTATIESKKGAGTRRKNSEFIISNRGG